MTHTPSDSDPPVFDQTFQDQLFELLRWRRDVRHFRPDPIAPSDLNRLLEAAMLAPSVGLSQPWRYVQVQDPKRRRAIREIFKQCNREALAAYHGEQARLYASLKLAGLEDAPVHYAVYCDVSTDQGHGLGSQTMPETLQYSVVASIQNLWLAARALGIGVGWVSILDPQAVLAALDLPATWELTAYLCVGYPIEAHLDPELERRKWEARADPGSMLLIR